MEISVVTTIPHPREQVWATMRDHLPELAAYLPNVDAIEVRERTEPSPGEVRLVNLWKAAKTEVPAVARPFIDPSKLNWIDRAAWDQDRWTCEWVIEVAFMPDRVTCKGTTTYEEAGPDTTRMRMKGVLELNLKGLLPGLVARSAQPKVEGFIVKLIEPNFEKTSDAVKRYLDAQRKA